MKFYSSALTDLIKKIEEGIIQTILIYGVNQGFATTAIQQIIAKLNLRVRHFDAKELTPTKLELIANSRNFFGQRELILKHRFTVGPNISLIFEVVLSATLTEPNVRLIL